MSFIEELLISFHLEVDNSQIDGGVKIGKAHIEDFDNRHEVCLVEQSFAGGKGEALFQLYWVKSPRIRNLVEFNWKLSELDGDGSVSTSSVEKSPVRKHEHSFNATKRHGKGHRH